MLSASPQPSEAKDWRSLYVAALVENDKNKIPCLIVDAEHAILERARELFKVAGDHIEEEQAIDDALYALHALRTCLSVHSGFAEAA